MEQYHEYPHVHPEEAGDVVPETAILWDWLRSEARELGLDEDVYTEQAKRVLRTLMERHPDHAERMRREQEELVPRVKDYLVELARSRESETHQEKNPTGQQVQTQDEL